jgi:hypothetical protein
MPTKEGAYSKVTGHGDKVRQGGGADKPYGSPRQLDVDVIDDHSSLSGGAARKLPRKA